MTQHPIIFNARPRSIALKLVNKAKIGTQTSGVPSTSTCPLYYLIGNLTYTVDEMPVVYRDKRGVEYESVPLPTNEVTDAVPLTAHIVSKRVARKTAPLYEGTDGAQLAQVPRSQRRNWTDEQWGAYEEYRRLETDQSGDRNPRAAVVVIRSERQTPTDQSLNQP